MLIKATTRLSLCLARREVEWRSKYDAGETTHAYAGTRNRAGKPSLVFLRILSLQTLEKHIFPKTKSELTSLLESNCVCSFQKRCRRRLGEPSKMEAGPRMRIGRTCHLRMRCYTKCRGLSPSCPTFPAALRLTPTSGGTSCPR